MNKKRVQRFSRAGPRGRGRELATLGVHPLSWLLSNNRLEDVCGTLTTATFSSRLLLSNQDKGCTLSVAHSLPLPLGPALLNLSNICAMMDKSRKNDLTPFRYKLKSDCYQDEHSPQVSPKECLHVQHPL